jgi:hypothetical protein
MKPDDAARFYQALKSLELFFRDTLSDEHRLLYWQTMRDRCGIDAWEYACEEVLGTHDFHTVPLPAVLLPYVEEYRTERRRQAEIELARRVKQLEAGPEPSRDPSFQGTEAERKAFAAAQAASLRAQLDARWNAMDRKEHSDDPL